MSKSTVWAASAGFALALFLPPFLFLTLIIASAIGAFLLAVGAPSWASFPGNLALTYILLFLLIRYGAWKVNGV